jgi:hypothetical protein
MGCGIAVEWIDVLPLSRKDALYYLLCRFND